MALQAYKYDRRGVLAVSPKAFYELFFCDDEQPREVIERDGAAIVEIRGPLETDSHPWRDSYADIITRIAQACESSAQRIVMRIDSPGGQANGLFEAVDQISQLCAMAGKPLLAYIDGDACSAAYALATAASYISMGQTALAGSIGVLCTREDYSAANAERGIRVEFIASGQRKADGHPDRPISEAELLAKQEIVDAMAATFFELVATRRGVSVETIGALQGAVLHAQAAQAAGLIDSIGSLTTLLADAASPTSELNMTAYEKAKAALEQAAQGTDANAEAARRALKALEPASAPQAEDPPADEPMPPAEDEPSTEAPKAEDMPDDEKSPSALAYRVALEAKTALAKLRAEMKARDERDERAALIASRPDLTEDVVMLLQRAPIALVREHIASLPTVPAGLEARTGQTARTAVRGQGQGDAAPHLTADEKADLDMRMGLVDAKPTVVNTPYKLTLGAHVAPNTDGTQH